ncbi:GIN domain-containing protein [Pedobacter sp.]|uniref:GIN domain-containing protein n=1 Tax=Pedobacter sp. TaxID=1411316 RepID=UPI00396CE781
MKTFITTLITASIFSVIGLNSTYAADSSNEKAVTTLSDLKNIKKIVANGNVEILLLQAPIESVKVYDSYYAKNALVQQQNGELRISSFEKEPLTVAVYVKNINTIEACGNATVKTVNKVNFLELSIILKDNAKANINANTVSLYTNVTDRASITLSGAAETYYAELGMKASLNLDKFKAETSDVKSLAPVYAKNVANKKITLDDLLIEDPFAK